MKLFLACFTFLLIQGIAVYAAEPTQQDVADTIKDTVAILSQNVTDIEGATDDRIVLTNMVKSWIKNGPEYAKLLEGGNATPEQIAVIVKHAEDFANIIEKTEALEVLLIDNIGRSLIKTLRQEVATPLKTSSSK